MAGRRIQMDTSSKKQGRRVILKLNIAFFTFIILLTLYIALDVFVIPRGYTVNFEDGNWTPRAFTFTPVTPTNEPSATPSEEATEVPTEIITEIPTENVTPEPTEGTMRPGETPKPTSEPTGTPVPTAVPTPTPTPVPTKTPSPTPVPTPTPDPHFTSNTVITEDTYIDENINIKVTLQRQYDTDIHVAEIYIRTPEYFRTAFAQNKFGRNYKEVVSSMAERNGAVLAINGDYYGARNKGYVIRYGQLFRESSNGNDCLAFMSDGSFKIVKEGKVSAKSLLEQGAIHAFTFGPGLVDDGKILVSKSYEVEKSLSSNQRVAIGMVEPLHYFIAVSDGRIKNNAGLTVYQLAEYMKQLGCKCAYNLDGGGSATMVFLGNVINVPTSHGKVIEERAVSDIVYFR